MNRSTPKYYLYISDTKLDMLYPQLGESAASKKSMEWGLSVKLASFKRKSETPTEITKYDKLAAVIQRLEETGSIGSIEEPGSYFRAEMEMRCFLDDRPRHPGSAGLAFFTGSNDKGVVACGGSLKHVIGNLSVIDKETVNGYASSLLHHLFGYMERLVRTDGTVGTDEDIEWSLNLAARTERLGVLRNNPTQNVEMVAKTLMTGNTTLNAEDVPTHVVLGTPLYVALAETESEKQMAANGALI